MANIKSHPPGACPPHRPTEPTAAACSEDESTAALTGDPGFLERVRQLVAAAAAAAAAAAPPPDSLTASAVSLHERADPAESRPLLESTGSNNAGPTGGTTSIGLAQEGEPQGGPLPPPGFRIESAAVGEGVFVGRFKGKGWEAKKREMQRVRRLSVPRMASQVVG